MYKNIFKFNMCNVEKHIFESSENEILKDENLEIISGGKLDNKFLASSLSALSMLTGTGIIDNTETKAIEPVTSVASQKVEKADTQEIQYFTKQQIIEDIDYVMDKLSKNHVGCIERIPEEVLQQKELEIKKLPDSISSIEAWRIISRILAKLHDAHTIALGPKFLYGSLYRNVGLPFDVEYLNDKLICKSGEFKDSEIIEINGIKITDIYENFKLHFSHEIEEWTHVNFFRLSPFIERSDLARAGIDVLKPIEVSFKTDGKIFKQKFNFIERTLKQEPFVSYEIDKENSVGIFTLNACKYNKEFGSIVDNFFNDVSTNNIKNIVIDLRKNCGGNCRPILYFANYIKNLETFYQFKTEIRSGNEIEKKQIIHKIDRLKYSDINLFDGKIFILTSNATFSNGMAFALYFSDNNLATLVGEVPGNSPCSYGDTYNNVYYTPNSKLRFRTTYKKFNRPDEAKDPDRLIPDVQVPAEKALDKVYELIKSK